MNDRRRVRVGTRASALARTQTRIVADRLTDLGWTIETVLVRSAGDVDRTAAPYDLPRGAFVSALEDALLRGEVDVAVHSAKDLPTDETQGLVVAAFPPRADPLDGVITATSTPLADLPPEARIGTGSPRRRAFLLRERQDFRIASIRGNVDTRIAMLDDGEYDAIVLACAGLDRLGLSDRVTERLDPDRMLPAVGQGALAVQVREGSSVASGIGALDDRPTRARLQAERAFLRAMGGGCRTPLAALAEIDGDALQVRAAALDAEGEVALFSTVRGTVEEADALGAAAADRLLEAGAGSLATA